MVEKITKTELAAKLWISRPTLDKYLWSRLERGNVLLEVVMVTVQKLDWSEEE